MNSKRMKYTTPTSKEEIIIQQQQQQQQQQHDVVADVVADVEDETGATELYTYAYATNDDEVDEGDVDDEEIDDVDDDVDGVVTNAQEVIIDEHGHAVTLQQLVENSTVEEVETIEQGDGTHTILHIVPNMQQQHVVHDVDDVEHDELDDDVDDEDVDDGGDNVGVEEGEVDDVDDEEADGDEDDDELGSIVYEGTIDHSPDSDSQSSRNKTFYCPNCGNCYSAAGSLKLHMRACLRQRNEVSAEDRKCKVCSKIFNSVAYLKEHMMRHTGEQPFRCTRCYRKFVDESKYNTHMDSHKHQDKLEAEAEALAAQHGGKKVVVKEFTCSFCAQNFTVVFDVGQVKRRYACDACRDKYSNAEALRQHKQQVEEKREFSCERCGRKFVFEGFLQRHLPTCDGSIKRRRDMK
ncbi:zinc finger E-box-binding homeobox 1 [Drosophila sulfurigaster albostrigata]|uniref:zinc finger E-box-binding homeobox 1 n=1 Tax=Drosophila sulfurigaster albostrigata TaxID=89887 RepID=UPI002D21A84A|nr:zinc finger E-box-binding homeobox 1 [Drosophila sulfurigaster albostrigata]